MENVQSIKQLKAIKAPTVQEVMGKQLPEKKFRASPITATIWSHDAEKDGRKFQYKTVVVERTYRDNKSGEFKTTSSLRVNDLPKAIVVMNKAYEYLTLVDAESISEEEF
jgi:hypothetical protein